MHVITHHFTLLAVDRAGSCLRQVKRLPLPAGLEPVSFSPEEIRRLNSQYSVSNKAGVSLTDSLLVGYTYLKGNDPNTFHLWKGGFVCAPDNMGSITSDRRAPAHWETFHLVDEGRVPAFLRVTDQKEAAFVSRVQELRDTNVPVLLHFGCGARRLDGFLNIDKFLNFGAPEDYFQLDFAEKPWPIPDSSVDYIYSEDFIEHIPQRLQVGFLAEAYRVLKPGAFNRISTPCLVDSMRRNSDFAKGMDGVYFGEFDKWGHICLFTRGLMADLAEAIGYRYVYFTAKSCGSSQFALADNRPFNDRDLVTGNLFADLMK